MGQLFKCVVVALVFLCFSCSSVESNRPPADHYPSAQWIKTLQLTKSLASDKDKYILRHGSNMIEVSAHSSKAMWNRKEPIYLGAVVRYYAGDLYLAPRAVRSLKNKISPHQKIAPVATHKQWQPPQHVEEVKWKYIVMHHSGSHSDSASTIDRKHREDRNFDELGYHFVIGNGSESGDGVIEVGSRWKKQKHGAHMRVDPNDDNRYNRFGIGVCLVGNFQGGHKPTKKQMESAIKLVSYLKRRYGVSKKNIFGHGSEEHGDSTICPGDFPMAAFKAKLP